MDIIDSFHFDTQTFLSLPEQNLKEMISECSFDEKSLHVKNYEDEESLRDINPEDFSEWIDCDHLLKMEFDNELNSCDFSENIFSDARAVTAITPNTGIDLNARVLEFALKMSNLSISMQKSELTRAAIRQHRCLFLEQNALCSGLTVPCSSVYQGDINELTNIDCSKRSLPQKYFENE